MKPGPGHTGEPTGGVIRAREESNMDDGMTEAEHISPEQQYQREAGYALRREAGAAASRHLERAGDISMSLARGLATDEAEAAVDTIAKIQDLAEAARKLLLRGQSDAERLQGPTEVHPAVAARF